jgi:hypothetical protein
MPVTKSSPLRRHMLDRFADRIVAQYRDGRSLREIASMYSCHCTSVRKILVKQGVMLRGPGRSGQEQRQWWMEHRIRNELERDQRRA